jgi:RNA polymerase sigma factor (sigma-70 family)
MRPGARVRLAAIAGAMKTVGIDQETRPVKAAAFTTTHWSVVQSAAQPDPEEAATALDKLCRTYWYPLYAFIRRRGHDVHDAEDLTQDFFARLLEKDFLRAVDRSKGKFRSFLLAALDHFLANEWRRRRTQKRGGQFSFISVDAEPAEQQYLQLRSADLSPDQLFEQQWALQMLRQVLLTLQQEFVDSGKGFVFEQLKVFLTGDKQGAYYAELAAKLGTTEAALKMAVSRMRHRYRELWRAEVARTVATPEDVDDELRALFVALSG